MRRRILASALSVCMVLTLLPMTASAAVPAPGVSALCEHHTEHTPECGYAEAVEGVPCGFNLNAPEEASPSDAPEAELTEHLHDEECGYIEAAEGTPCGYVCEICNAAEELPTVDSGVAEQQPALLSDVMPIATGWELDGNGLLTISTDDGMDDWVANGSSNKSAVKVVRLEDAVTAIAVGAFEGCNNLTSATGEGVLTIGKSAFCNGGSPKLKTVNFPNATSIGDEAFYGCCALTDVNFPIATTIGEMAFYESNLSAPSFPEVITVGMGAFACIDRNTTSLKSISLPKVTSIGNMAFMKCQKLAEISLPATPPTVKENPFNGCTSPRKLKFVDENGTELADKAAAITAYGEVVDGDSSADLWYGCTINPTVPLENRITVKIDDSDETFSTSLEAAVGDKAATLTKLEICSGSFFEVDWLYLNKLTALKSFKIDAAVETIQEMPQRGIGETLFPKSIESVSMPTVTKLGNYAFLNCDKLTDISFPKVENIGGAGGAAGHGSSTFSGCKSLKTAAFPNVKTMGEVSFNGCTSLVELSLPAEVPDVDSNLLFDSCPTPRKLKFIDVDGKALTGDPLKAAIAAYTKAGKDDGITDDGLWYGWKLPPTVTSVAVTPKTPNVQKGSAQQFSAAVTGSSSPAQTVTWSVAGTANVGTSINISGLLTVAADETATSLTVKATSTVDTSKSDTAAVTVTTTPVTKYALTVTDGTGSGSFEAGQSVTITANAPEANKLFDKWTTTDGVTFADANVATTTITMPAGAVTVTATYKDTPVNPTAHTITASVGTGGSISPSGTVMVNNGGSQTFTISANSNYSIASVTVDGVNQGVISTYVFNNVIGNHTISANFNYNGGGSSGGSDSGGSSSGGGTVTPSTPPATDTPSKGESTVTAPVDKNGNASITVTDKNISDAIAQAKKDTVQGQPISVSIKVETDKTATQITATLPKTVQETLISNKVDSVTIASNTVTMSFSQTAIQQMNGQAKADITIIAAKVDTGKLTGDAKALIGSRPMYDFTASYGTNKSITDFGNNTVSIAIPYTLGKGETAGNIQAVYVDDNGKATVITNSSYDANKKAVIFTTSHFSGYGVGYKQTIPVYNDITDHWAKNDIEFVAARGLLSGTGNNAFSPNTAMTRGMFVTTLGRMAGIDINSYKSGSFTDVKADVYYAPYVNWAASKGITSGTTATTFSPDQTVTRQEMAVFMANYAKAMGYPVPKTRTAVTFADNASIGSWAAEAVKSMQMAGVIMGKDGNKFDPTGTATRAEVSAVLRRYMELVIDRTTAQGLDVNDSGKIVYYENGKLFKGTKTIDGTTYYFGTDGICTRIDAVVPDTKKYAIHKIVVGDTLWDIAMKNKCTVAEIVGLNGIADPNNVPVGTELKIPQK